MQNQKAYPVWHFTLDATAITVFLTYAALFCTSLFSHYETRAATTSHLGLQLVLYALLAWLMADFVSGFVHFLADNFGTPETPIVGKVFVYAFREHHVDPKAITRHSYVETNGANSLVSLPWMLYVYYASAPVVDFTFRFFMVFFFLSIFMTNQFHKWAHMEKPPVVAALLQRAHIILPPAHHDIHHVAPYDKYYCITCGWLNAPLNSLHFFQAVKKVLRWDFR